MNDDAHFMKAALELARSALDAGEFPVGCVLVHDGRIIADGRRSGTAHGRPNEVDHAEIMALRRMAEIPHAPAPAGVTAYSTMEPCLMCLAALMLTGVGRVAWAYEDVMGGATRFDLTNVAPLYKQRPIRITPNVMRAESLALFRAYFARPENDYWRGSLLAAHTLGQAP